MSQTPKSNCTLVSFLITLTNVWLWFQNYLHHHSKPISGHTWDSLASLLSSGSKLRYVVHLFYSLFSSPHHITFICTWCITNHSQEWQMHPKSPPHTHRMFTLAHSPGLCTAVIACGRACRWIDSFSSTDTIIHEATTHSNTTLLQYLSLSLLGAEMNLCTVRPVLLRPSA